MTEAEKAMIFHALAMLLKLEAERSDHTEKKQILNDNATLMQDVGIRLGGSIMDIKAALTDGNERGRRAEALARAELVEAEEVH